MPSGHCSRGACSSPPWPRRGEGAGRQPAGSARMGPQGAGAGSSHRCGPTPAPGSPQGRQPLHSHRGTGAGGRQVPALGPQDPGSPRGHGTLPRAVRTGAVALCWGPAESPLWVPAARSGGTRYPQVRQEGPCHPSGSPGLGPRGCHRPTGTWACSQHGQPVLGLPRLAARPGRRPRPTLVPLPRVSHPTRRAPDASCLPRIVEQLLEGNSLMFLLLCVTLPGSPQDWDAALRVPF